MIMMMNNLPQQGVLSEVISEVIRICFFGKDYREIPLVSQGKRNHNICGIRLDYGVRVFEECRCE